MIIANSQQKVNKMFRENSKMSVKEKMNYSKLIEKIEQKVDFKPKQADLCRILKMSTSTMARRVMRDSKFSDDELRKLEDYYGISFKSNSTSDNCVTLDYYPNVFGSCGCGCMVFDESKEKISVAKDMIMNY